MGPYIRWVFLGLFIFLALMISWTFNRNSFVVRSIRSGQRISISAFTGEKEYDDSPIIETVYGPKSYKELDERLFRPMGYKLRENNVIPALDFIEQPNCPKVFSDWLHHSEGHNESGTPPVDIPANLLEAYTFGGMVHLIKGYMDDRSGTQNAVWSREVVVKAIATEPKKVVHTYAGDEEAIYQAMKAYNVTGQRGAVVGSLTPWVEAFALKLGAEHMTTMEYMHIDTPNEDRIDYKHPIEVAKEASKHFGKYDFFATFSSIEHSGLGRYGDALDPIGDLREAMKIHCMLKDKGLLFICLPSGWDTLHWNLHRIYGRIRWALFAAGFDIIDLFDRNQRQPITEDRFKKPFLDKNLGYVFHPIIETLYGPKSYKELDERLFRPMGYKLRENNVIPALDFIEQPNCPKVFSDWLHHSEGHNESGTPPVDIPANLLEAYTFGGMVHLIKG